MPRAPAKQDQNPAGDDAPALWQAPAIILMDGCGLVHLVFGAAGNLALETLDIGVRIQSQMPGIGTHETDRVSLARQVFQPVFLQRFQMVLADLERARDLRDLVAAPQTRGAQLLADCLDLGIMVSGNLAQMNAPAARPVIVTTIIQGHLRKLGHPWPLSAPCPEVGKSGPKRC